MNLTNEIGLFFRHFWRGQPQTNNTIAHWVDRARELSGRDSNEKDTIAKSSSSQGEKAGIITPCCVLPEKDHTLSFYSICFIRSYKLEMALWRQGGQSVLGELLLKVVADNILSWMWTVWEVSFLHWEVGTPFHVAHLGKQEKAATIFH